MPGGKPLERSGRGGSEPAGGEAPQEAEERFCFLYLEYLFRLKRRLKNKAAKMALIVKKNKIKVID
jgi:hypothetical protein